MHLELRVDSVIILQRKVLLDMISFYRIEKERKGLVFGLDR